MRRIEIKFLGSNYRISPRMYPLATTPFMTIPAEAYFLAVHATREAKFLHAKLVLLSAEERQQLVIGPFEMSFRELGSVSYAHESLLEISTGFTCQGGATLSFSIEDREARIHGDSFDFGRAYFDDKELTQLAELLQLYGFTLMDHSGHRPRPYLSPAEEEVEPSENDPEKAETSYGDQDAETAPTLWEKVVRYFRGDL